MTPHDIAAVLLGRPVPQARLVSGEFHDVVVVPGVAAVKIARGTAADHLSRRSALLARLARLDLPFAVPAPLGPVAAFGDRRAVALSWLPGSPATPDALDGAGVRDLLAALADVDTRPLAATLDVPHAYAGRDRWADLVLGEVVPRLPEDVSGEARRRVAAALDLPAAEPSLVHGDLAGANLLVEGGRVVAVLDWDLAAAWDPAVDAACLSWFGWDVVSQAVGVATVDRARTWAATFVLEQAAAAIDGGAADEVVEQALGRAAVHLRT